MSIKIFRLIVIVLLAVFIGWRQHVSVQQMNETLSTLEKESPRK